MESETSRETGGDHDQRGGQSCHASRVLRSSTGQTDVLRDRTDAAKTGFDFYGGAGWKQVFSSRDSSATDLYSLLRDSGYVVIDPTRDFRALSAGREKVVYVQPEDYVNPSSLPTAIDRAAGDMTLSDITGKAIQFLSERNDAGFFLMVEGGIIDWLCHANDAGAAFREIVDFSDAIQVALEFYKAHPMKP